MEKCEYWSNFETIWQRCEKLAMENKIPYLCGCCGDKRRCIYGEMYQDANMRWLADNYKELDGEIEVKELVEKIVQAGHTDCEWIWDIIQECLYGGDNSKKR